MRVAVICSGSVGWWVSGFPGNPRIPEYSCPDRHELVGGGGMEFLDAPNIPAQQDRLDASLIGKCPAFSGMWGRVNVPSEQISSKKSQPFSQRIARSSSCQGHIPQPRRSHRFNAQGTASSITRRITCHREKPLNFSNPGHKPLLLCGCQIALLFIVGPF